MKGLQSILCFICFMLFTQYSLATELVYTPVNPSFGGNPINGTYLLNQAQAQDKHKDPNSVLGRDPMEYFEESLVRRVLNNLATQVIDDAFGAGDAGLTSGFYQFGDYTIDVDASNTDILDVTISDLGSGNTTSIQIPTTY